MAVYSQSSGRRKKLGCRFVTGSRTACHHFMTGPSSSWHWPCRTWMRESCQGEFGGIFPKVALLGGFEGSESRGDDRELSAAPPYPVPPPRHEGGPARLAQLGRVPRDQDIPRARMAETLTRPIHEIAATFSIGSQPQSAISQKRAARKAFARSRPRPPMERRVSRRQITQPISRTTPAKTSGGRHCQPVRAAQA